VLGSISLTFLCIFGILIALYCFTRAKKVPSDSSYGQFDYSYVDDEPINENSEIEEERETTFNDNSEYHPPVITPVANNNNNNNNDN